MLLYENYSNPISDDSPLNDENFISDPFKIDNDLFLCNNIKNIPFQGKWIGSAQIEIDRILTDDKNYNVFSNMYTGKTYSFITRAHQLELKMVVLQPLQINVRQKFNEFKKNGIKVGYIHGKRKNEGRGKEEISFIDIQKMIKENNLHVILCVYNSFFKLLSTFKFNPADYILIIDEAHLLTSQYSFRSSEINYIIENKNKFKKVINISGTPEGTVFNDYNTRVFSGRLKPEAAKPEIEIVPYHKHGAYKIFKHAVSKISNHRIIIVKDDIKHLFNLRAAFVQWGVEERNIKVLSSQDKGSEDFIYLEEMEKIPERIKILLTTRVISDGANIYGSKADLIYFWDVTDFGMKRQFISRFRDGIKMVYDFLPYNSENIVNKFPFKETFLDFRKIYEEQKSAVQKMCYLKTSLNSETALKEKSSDLPHMTDVDGYILYSTNINGYRISDEKLLYYLLEKYYAVLSLNSKLAKEYYTNTAGYETTIRKFNENDNADIKREDFSKLISLDRANRNGDEISLILENFNLAFIEYIKKHGKIILDSNMVDAELLTTTISPDKNKYVKELLSKSTHDKIFKTIFDLAIEGYPRPYLLKVAEMLYWRKNVAFYKEQRTLDYFFDMYIVNEIPLVVDLYKIHHTFNSYKLIKILLNRIVPRKKIIRIEAEKEFLVKESEKLGMDINWLNYEFRSIINGLFMCGPRKQQKSKITLKHETRKVLYYYYELNGHRGFPDFPDFYLPASKLPIDSIALIPYLRLQKKITNVLETSHLTKRNREQLEKLLLQVQAQANSIKKGDHLPY